MVNDRMAFLYGNLTGTVISYLAHKKTGNDVDEEVLLKQLEDALLLLATEAPYVKQGYEMMLRTLGSL